MRKPIAQSLSRNCTRHGVERVSRLVLLALLFASYPGLAAPKAQEAIVILDLRDGADSLNRIFTFPDSTSGQVSHLKQSLDQAKKSGEIENALREARGLLGVPRVKTESTPQDATKSAPTQSDRWIATTGAILHVYVVYDSPKTRSSEDLPFTVAIQESARDTRLAQDLATALKVASSIKSLRATEPALHAQDYALTKTRATLVVTAKVKGASAKDGAAEAANPELKATIITGPTEHFFLSADLPITKATQLSYDSTTLQLTSKDVPTTFYFAVDYTLGDVLSAERTLWEGITLKAMFKVSKNPLDSYGVGLGYRLRNTRLFAIELDAFSPFVAVLWTKQDTDNGVNAAGQHLIGSEYHANVRAGLSFNLDKALDWLKK